MPQAPLIIIQARLGSKRLPGKVLMPIKGKPMLQYLLERAVPYRCIVATPDLEICRAITSEWWHVVSVPVDDVAGRFASVLHEWNGATTFIRLCGDSPLMDPALIDAAIALYQPPYFIISSPVGCVEVCDTKAFLATIPGMSASEREHVTTRLRQQAGAGRYHHLGNDPRLVVDTQEDFDRVRGVIEKMDRPHQEYGWRECVGLI